MLRITDVKIKIGYSYENLISAAAARLKTDRNKIEKVSIYKRSLDARKKNNIFYLMTLDVCASVNEDELIAKLSADKVSKAVYPIYNMPHKTDFKKRPIVIGFGPAGIFASLVLAECGANPIIFERGMDVDNRKKSVEQFFSAAQLDENSNVQFGEGGAGTFSDGKLNTGIKDPRIRMVLSTFVENGAPSEILYDSKPHIGTDKLPNTIKNIRNKIISLGGQVHFNSTAVDFKISDGKIKGVYIRENDNVNFYESDHIILAVGHSARDTFRNLYDNKIFLEPKPFSVGVRIEHRREMINKCQYGIGASVKGIPTADYKLSAHLTNGRGVYTFCMCPGGTVVGAASCKNSVVTNGMSEFARDGENSNSAVLVGITPEDYGAKTPLDGMIFQEEIEKKAFILAGSNYNAPAQRFEDFCMNRETKDFGQVQPTYKPGVSKCNINLLFPNYITESIKYGIMNFGKRIYGFDYGDAVLTAPETRSSSPVRIVRDDFLNSVSVKGLYPCGEGAGYAGGITSAAVDGIKCAEAIIESVKER